MTLSIHVLLVLLLISLCFVSHGSSECYEKNDTLWDIYNTGSTPSTRTVRLTVGSTKSTSQTSSRQQSSSRTSDTESSQGSSRSSSKNAGGGIGFGPISLSGGVSSGSGSQSSSSQRSGQSSTSGSSWESQNSNLFNQETSTDATYTCEPMTHCIFMQVVGICGSKTVRTSKEFAIKKPIVTEALPKVDSGPIIVKLAQRSGETWVLVSNLTFKEPSGLWETTELCGPASFVNGFSLKSAGNGGGLSGLSLKCSSKNSTSPFVTVKEITSGMGVGDGKWVTPFRATYPTNYADGFLFQSWTSKTPGGSIKSYKGNWKLTFQGRPNYLFLPRGSRSPKITQVRCPEKYAICGIVTMLDEKTHSLITHIGLKCCYYCVPEQKLVTQDSFKNIAMQASSHTVHKSVGVSRSTGTSTGGSNGTEAHESSEGRKLSGVQAGFAATFGGSESSGFNWGSTSSSTWNEETSKTFSWVCSPRHACTVKQLIGICGEYKINTPHTEIESIPLPPDDN